MSDDTANQNLSLWQRYRRSALVLGTAFAVILGARFALPGLDFSRGSPGRWVVIGIAVVVMLAVGGGRRLLRKRSGLQKIWGRDGMRDERRELARGFNRRNVLMTAVMGTILLGFSVWALVVGRSSEIVVTAHVFGVTALLAATVMHRLLLRRDQV